MHKLAGWLAVVALSALPVCAQSLPEAFAGAEEIPFEEWSAMATGRTLVYRINGRIWAMEYYYPGTNRVTLQLTDGECLHGTWDYTAPYYCFHWVEQGTSCFRHARQDGRIIVIEPGDEERLPSLQHMSAVTDIPLDCGHDLVS